MHKQTMKDQAKEWQTKEVAEFIINGMMSGCIQMSVAAKEAYRELVCQFCDDNKDIVSPVQYEKCLNDFEYFLSLIDQTAVLKKK